MGPFFRTPTPKHSSPFFIAGKEIPVAESVMAATPLQRSSSARKKRFSILVIVVVDFNGFKLSEGLDLFVFVQIWIYRRETTLKLDVNQI
jgi:hypothetical protein